MWKVITLRPRLVLTNSSATDLELPGVPSGMEWRCCLGMKPCHCMMSGMICLLWSCHVLPFDGMIQIHTSPTVFFLGRPPASKSNILRTSQCQPAHQYALSIDPARTTITWHPNFPIFIWRIQGVILLSEYPGFKVIR